MPRSFDIFDATGKQIGSATERGVPDLGLVGCIALPLGALFLLGLVAEGMSGALGGGQMGKNLTGAILVGGPVLVLGVIFLKRIWWLALLADIPIVIYCLTFKG